MNDDDEPKQIIRSSLILPILAALLSSHAEQLGGLYTGISNLFGHASIEEYRLEAGLVTLAFGLVILTNIRARKALQSGDMENMSELFPTLLVGIVGGFFAVMDTKLSDKGIFLEGTLRSLYLFSVTAIILLIPMSRSLSSQLQVKNVVEIYRDQGMVILLALAIAGTVHWGLKSSHLLREVISAPSAAALFAAWAFLAVDPVLNQKRWTMKRPWWWLIALSGLGFLLVAGFAQLIYFEDHKGDAWIVAQENPRTSVTVVFFALQIPAILGAISMALAFRPCSALIGKAAARASAVCLVIAIGAAFAFFASNILIPGFDLGEKKFVLFLFAHGVTAGATTFAVLWGTNPMVQSSSASIEISKNTS